MLPVIDLLLIFFSCADGVINISLTLLHVTTDSNSQKFFMVTGGLTGNTVSQTDGNGYRPEYILQCVPEVLFCQK